jgi:hypothetical protein
VHRILPTVLLAGASICSVACAQSIAPPFDANYTLVNLGSAVGVPASYGGLVIRPQEPNALYLMGAANGGAGALYRVALERDSSGHIVGWGCSETVYVSSAPNNDGGIAFLPSGAVIYTLYPSNYVGQILPGDTAPSVYTDLTALGIAGSVGSLAFVPAGLPGAGRLKIASYNTGYWYDTSYTTNPDGTITLTGVGPLVNIGGGPEGIAFVPAGNPGFAVNSIVVSEYSTGTVVAYESTGTGDPDPTTRRPFVVGLSGAEGAAIDPLTGDFLFSTFGGSNRVYRVSGFTESATCIGDLDNNGIVDGADLGRLLAAWGPCSGCQADLNGDCVVDGIDLGILLGKWGPCP